MKEIGLKEAKTRGIKMKIDLENSYDKNLVVCWLGGIFGICAFVFLLFLFWWNQRILPVDVSSCQMDTGQLVYNIKKTYGRGYIQLDGYAYMPGSDILNANTTILAYNRSENRYYELPTECVEKPKITKNAADGFNYDYCGFRAIVLEDKISKDDEIYIRCRNNGADILLDTGENFHK